VAAATADLHEPVRQIGRCAGAFFQDCAAGNSGRHDELDINPGQVKLKLGGSHAGHNGLRDIHAQLGSGDYWRLRLGVGHPGNKAEVVNWVLKKPSLDHRIAIEQCIDRSLKALPRFLAGDMDKAMLLVHTSKPPGARKTCAGRPPAVDAFVGDDQSHGLFHFHINPTCCCFALAVPEHCLRLRA
jgi:hypothetical protein